MDISLRIGVLSLVIISSSCSAPYSDTDQNSLERYNRKMFTINRSIDKHFIRPISTQYDRVIPSWSKNRVTDFFRNFSGLNDAFNDALQGHVEWALYDVWRFVFNSTFGFLGFFDISTMTGLPEHYQTFGLTMAHYGYTSSRYVVLPLLGSTTIRDGLGMIVDYSIFSPWSFFSVEEDMELYSIDMINYRAQTLDMDRFLDQAFDPYIFTKDAYLQYIDALMDNH